MAPHPQTSKRGAISGSEPQVLQTRDGSVVVSSPWIVVAIIFGALIVVTSTIFVVIYFKRRQRKARRQSRRQRQLPAISMRHEAVQRRRRNMSAFELQEAEELERSFMIRKSLASRSTTSTIASRDSHMMQSARSSRLTVHDVFEEPGRAEDRKECEENMREERRHSRLQELVIAGQSHPALAREMAPLPIPRKVRASSPPRDSVPPRQMLPLPSLPSSNTTFV